MAEQVIIDTDILIDVGRGIHNANRCLQQAARQRTPAVSVVAQMELIVGCRNKVELHQLDDSLSTSEIIDVMETTSEIAVDLLRRYRLSHGLLIADALIASTALAPAVPLLSKNKRDYHFIKELTLLPYPL